MCGWKNKICFILKMIKSEIASRAAVSKRIQALQGDEITGGLQHSSCAIQENSENKPSDLLIKTLNLSAVGVPMDEVKNKVEALQRNENVPRDLMIDLMMETLIGLKAHHLVGPYFPQLDELNPAMIKVGNYRSHDDLLSHITYILSNKKEVILQEGPDYARLSSQLLPEGFNLILFILVIAPDDVFERVRGVFSNAEILKLLNTSAVIEFNRNRSYVAYHSSSDDESSDLGSFDELSDGENQEGLVRRDDETKEDGPQR